MLKHILHMLLAAAFMLSPGVTRGSILTPEQAKDAAADFFSSGSQPRLADAAVWTKVHTAVRRLCRSITFLMQPTALASS